MKSHIIFNYWENSSSKSINKQTTLYACSVFTSRLQNEQKVNKCLQFAAWWRSISSSFRERNAAQLHAPLFASRSRSEGCASCFYFSMRRSPSSTNHGGVKEAIDGSHLSIVRRAAGVHIVTLHGDLNARTAARDERKTMRRVR